MVNCWVRGQVRNGLPCPLGLKNPPAEDQVHGTGIELFPLRPQVTVDRRDALKPVHGIPHEPPELDINRLLLAPRLRASLKQTHRESRPDSRHGPLGDIGMVLHSLKHKRPRLEPLLVQPTAQPVRPAAQGLELPPHRTQLRPDDSHPDRVERGMIKVSRGVKHHPSPLTSPEAPQLHQLGDTAPRVGRHHAPEEVVAHGVGPHALLRPQGGRRQLREGAVREHRGEEARRQLGAVELAGPAGEYVLCLAGVVDYEGGRGEARQEELGHGAAEALGDGEDGG